MKWEGKEVSGLVAPRQHRPDGVKKNADGEVTDTFFYHGNRFHGYPPDHELHESEVTMPRGHKANSRSLYEKTMSDMQLFKDRGYTVSYMWEHEHKAAIKSRVPMMSIVRYL